MKQLVTLFLLFCFFYGVSQKEDRTIDSLKQLIKSLKDKKRISEEKSILILKYYTAGNLKEAKYLLDLELEEAKRMQASYALGSLYNVKGTIFYYESKFDSSFLYLEKSLAIKKKTQDTIGTLKLLSNMGAIHYMLNNLKESLTFYEEGLTKEAELNFPEGEYISLNNLGTIHNSLKFHDKALSYFRKAERSNLKRKNLNELIYTYDGFFRVYQKLKMYDSAKYYAKKSVMLSKQVNDRLSLSYQYHAVGAVLKDLKQNEEALNYFDSALVLAKELHDERLELTIYSNIAMILMESGKLDEAYEYMEKVVSLRKNLNVTINAEDQPKLFALYYSYKKDYKKAYDYYYQSLKLNDSLYQTEAAQQLNEMRTKYETEKKENENQLLKSENESYLVTRKYLLVVIVFALLGIIGAIFAYKKIKNSKTQISVQKHLVEEKQREILDSINYAKRIQFALLTSDQLLESNLPEHFVLFKPKDVVSGDFYWATPVEDGFIYVTGDCTGHGVPGAFMSLLNISKLGQIINEKKITQPDLILNAVRSEIIDALNPEGTEVVSKDGMDAIVCKLNLTKMKLEYAAANNSFYVVRNKKIIKCKADKMPVGVGHDDSIPFTFNEIQIQTGDTIYTLTDGYADQFGGMDGKKFKYKKLEEFLISINDEDLVTQKNLLDKAFEDWKGGLEQLDDVCVIGVRIS